MLKLFRWFKNYVFVPFWRYRKLNEIAQRNTFILIYVLYKHVDCEVKIDASVLRLLDEFRETMDICNLPIGDYVGDDFCLKNIKFKGVWDGK